MSGKKPKKRRRGGDPVGKQTVAGQNQSGHISAGHVSDKDLGQGNALENSALQESEVKDQTNAAGNDLSFDSKHRPSALTAWAFRISAVALIGWLGFLIYLAYRVSQS